MLLWRVSRAAPLMACATAVKASKTLTPPLGLAVMRHAAQLHAASPHHLQPRSHASRECAHARPITRTCIRDKDCETNVEPVRTHAHKNTRTHTRTHIHMHTYTHTRIYTHTHANTHKHTRDTHACAHSTPGSCDRLFCRLCYYRGCGVHR